MQFRDGFAELATGEQGGAVFEAQLQVGGVFLNAVLGASDLAGAASGEQFLEFGAFVRGVGCIWIGFQFGLEGGEVLVIDAIAHGLHFGGESGVGGIQAESVIVPLQGAGQVFFLFVEVADFFDDVDVLRVLVVFFTPFGEAGVELIRGHAFAAVVFQRFGLFFAFEQVAHAFTLTPSLAGDGRLGIGIGDAFAGFAVGIVDAQDGGEDIGGFFRLFVEEVVLRQAVHVFRIGRVAFADGFEREGSGFRHVEGDGGFVEHAIDLRVVRIIDEQVFQFWQGGGWFFFDHALEFHVGKPSTAEAAEQLFRSSGAFFVGGRGFAQFAASVEVIRFGLDDGQEQLHGVAHILRKDGGIGLLDERAEALRQVGFGNEGRGHRM